MRNLTSHKISLFVSLAILLFFSSCDTKRVYEFNIPITGEQWHKDSICSFAFEVSDTITVHNLLINIRNTGNYRYRNLLLYIDFTLPDQKTIVDTLNCVLADERGKWHGKGWGSIWSSTIPYKTRIRFPGIGEYQLNLAHAMRDENLKAVTDIGVRIEKTR
jgi:gliding motility-associated lipoprotein GldH